MSMTVEKKGAVQNGIKRAVFAGLAIILQILMIYFIYFRLETRLTWIANIITILAVLLVLYIYGRHETASVKMPWLIIISAFPILGVFLYLMVGLNKGTADMRNRYKALDDALLPLLPKNIRSLKGSQQKTSESPIRAGI